MRDYRRLPCLSSYLLLNQSFGVEEARPSGNSTCDRQCVLSDRSLPTSWVSPVFHPLSSPKREKTVLLPSGLLASFPLCRPPIQHNVFSQMSITPIDSFLPARSTIAPSRMICDSREEPFSFFSFPPPVPYSLCEEIRHFRGPPACDCFCSLLKAEFSPISTGSFPLPRLILTSGAQREPLLTSQISFAVFPLACLLLLSLCSLPSASPPLPSSVSLGGTKKHGRILSSLCLR